MRDFTLYIYKKLLEALLENGYQFIRFEQYLSHSYAQQQRADNEAISKLSDKYIILRHDVDLKAQNSLRTAQIEHELGIQASYYFRVVSESNQPEIIQAIAALGHEIGYHYEDMSICQGDSEKAYAHFVKQLAYFRTFYPVQTICMHGAPTSKWDGKDLWKKYNYRELGIIGEPYFDVDFAQMFYLTDTGRCWDGYKVSVRDKIPVHQDEWNAQGLVYHSTKDIIQAVQEQRLPAKIMITTHPQRWTNSRVAWMKELVVQSLKNTVKRLVVRRLEQPKAVVEKF